MKIGLFGTGAYGMALSSILADNNCEITMWTKFPEEQEILQRTRQQEKYITNFKLEKSIRITTSVEECTKGKDLLIIAIPSSFVESLCQEMKPFISDNHILIATKGIEEQENLFMHKLVGKYLNTTNIAVISGATFAADIVTKKPIGFSFASKSKTTTALVKKTFQNSYVKLKETPDMTGIELCGSLKNVIALASGILEGLNTNESTKAMLITEAIHDIQKILEVFNCDKNTILSFAGIGDLLLTCTSHKSRNFCFGKLIGEKASKPIIDKCLRETTIEGFYALKSINQLLEDKKVQIPIINIIYDIVIKETKPEEILSFLMSN